MPLLRPCKWVMGLHQKTPEPYVVIWVHLVWSRCFKMKLQPWRIDVSVGNPQGAPAGPTPPGWSPVHVGSWFGSVCVVCTGDLGLLLTEACVCFV